MDSTRISAEDLVNQLIANTNFQENDDDDDNTECKPDHTCRFTTCIHDFYDCHVSVRIYLYFDVASDIRTCVCTRF